MENQTWAVVAQYGSEPEAQIARTLLANAGIEATIRNEYMSAIYPVGAMPAQVVVAAAQAEAARKVLEGRKRAPGQAKKGSRGAGR